MAFASSGAAQTGSYALNIPAEPYPAAVLDFARQTLSSVGGVDPARCGGLAPALKGNYTAVAALRTLLRQSRCKVRRVDATTFILQIRILAPHIAPAPVAAVEPSTEVVVTANRRPQLAGRAPSAIGVIDAAALKGSGGNLEDIASHVPGLTLTNLGPGRDKILMRGISDGVFTGRTQSTVGLYLDDTPITFNAPDPDLLLVDMSRIEVLRGPQGALYGEGSISGVVRLVTHAPDLASTSASLSAGMGLAQTGAPSSRIEAVGNFAAIPGRLALRAVAYNDQSGGYINNRVPFKKNINATHRYGGRLAGRWRLNDKWSVAASFAAQEINAKDSQYVAGLLGSYARNVSAPEPHDNDFSDAAFTIEGHTSLGSVRASLNHLHHRIQSRYDASAIASYLAPGSGEIAYDQDQAVELTTREISLISPSDRRFRWMAGAFSSQSSESFSPTLIDTGTLSQDFTEQRHDRILTTAVFGEAALDLTPKLTLTAGLRESASRHNVASTQAMRTPAGNIHASTQDHLSAHKLSHQISLRYQPNPDTTFYILSAEGYRTGGFNTTRLAGTPGTPARYGGDELNSYEAGLKVRLPARSLDLSVAAYRVFWRNLQSDQLQATGLPVTVNIGNGVNKGLEFEADWQPLQPLHIHAAGLINEPKLTQPNPTFVTDEDSGLPYIARSSFSLGADWSQSLAGGTWRSSANLSWLGVSHLNFGPLQTIEMGGYGVLDLSSGLDLGPVSYDVRLDNATNRAGNSFAYGNPFSLSLMAQRTPQRPRTLWVTVRRAF